MSEHQISHTADIDAPPERVWEVLADQSVLPHWVPMVDEVLDVAGETDGLGMTRTCRVRFGRRTGTMTEQCVEFVPPRRATYRVTDDSLGFRKMLDDYRFSLTLDERPGGRCAVTIDTYYTPRNVGVAILNRLLLRRQMRAPVQAIASGLKRYSERADQSLT